ncbi:hypothetical protein DUNSADRAFT_757 [Dunaliella salina]|uniref:BTB domain-containing protein n=1 Tax=Dunaliella salina TaxID=3046 RepID=A0ABQ7FYG6_DUNSA|nr:hypothetical protein DUNSADRAFT_757 [Dunaliella salina]|eukprot:KAF5827392.1 hypothetical protein DUNSADRAFT_757 [Dunaliella salina]
MEDTQAPAPITVPASKFLLHQHSGVFRDILRHWPQRDRHVQECYTPEEMETGKLVVEMILNYARPVSSKRDAEFSSLPPSKLIRCMNYANYWNAPACVEYCLDCLTKASKVIPQLATFSPRDIEDLLGAPGSVMIQDELKRKVEDVCSSWLQFEFGSWRDPLGSDDRKRRLHSLSIHAIWLLFRTTCSSAYRCRVLASWYLHAHASPVMTWSPCSG